MVAKGDAPNGEVKAGVVVGVVVVAVVLAVEPNENGDVRAGRTEAGAAAAVS